MKRRCSVERNVQILIEVLKANNVKKIVVSPGATNVSFVASVQYDDYFEVFSAVDERGAAYIACGLAAESGEAVVITCTGATASRNYFPGLTEAFHKKYPVLAVTASQDFSNAGHLSPQFIERTEHPTDSIKLSVQVPVVRNDVDEWDCTIKINKAVTELFRNGGAPVHINLASNYNNEFTTDMIKPVRIIKRYGYNDSFPDIKNYKRIAISVGAHKVWSDELTKSVDEFCKNNNAVVFVDHSSGYWGEYRVLPTILATQNQHYTDLFDTDLLLHIGEEHGDYYANSVLARCKEVWRISEDGEIRDTFKKLTKVFQMDELTFFKHYAYQNEKTIKENEYYHEISREIDHTYSMLPELPFSNIWIARYVSKRIPANSAIHIGVSNTMRSWTFFDFPQHTLTLANTGCRGIDGAIATTLGMSLVDPGRIHYAVMGDLTFFYGLNALGNRHWGNNARIILVNNGCGAEFNLYQHRAYEIYEGSKDEINAYVAAGGHYSSKSKDTVKHFAEDLGFEYFRAENKEQFEEVSQELLDEKGRTKPMIFEVFTDTKDENEALKIVRTLRVDKTSVMKQKIAGILGESGVSAIKRIIK